MKMIVPSFSRKPVPLLAIVFFFVFLCTLLTNCKKNDTNNNNNNPPDSTKVDMQLVAEGFVSPIGVVASPDNTGRLFVIDQPGKIWIIDRNGNKLSTPFMDVTSVMVSLNPSYDERGLLGLAFHPQFSNNHKFYIYYQLPPRTGDNLSRISEFQASTLNPNVADMSTEKILLELDDPQSNHNGGTLAFGPDGFLYISIGDGGAGNDVGSGHVDDWYAANAGGNGQDIQANLFGNILRIDVDNGSPYGIPADNPFVGKDGLDEIYAYGFRNPFRMSFDIGGNHDLIAGDAGQSLYEEIDLVTKGGNYGWNVKEGRVCFNAAANTTTMPSCPALDNFNNPLIDPVVVVNNSANPQGGRALTIIGGNVYRGTAIPEYQGKYIFGSFGQGSGPDAELFISTPAGQTDWGFKEISLVSHPNDIGYYLKGFGQDNEGEIYLTVSSNMGPSGTTGKVFKLIKVP
ncbi:MAG TPA: PQQ-dependent sugar dehydrogenase [Chitinophagaceae bacterium]|nr:PQQ-dependent sugar dehydrogenase [Chitinophagaceae bacterium]